MKTELNLHVAFGLARAPALGRHFDLISNVTYLIFSESLPRSMLHLKSTKKKLTTGVKNEINRLEINPVSHSRFFCLSVYIDHIIQ